MIIYIYTSIYLFVFLIRSQDISDLGVEVSLNFAGPAAWHHAAWQVHQWIANGRPGGLTLQWVGTQQHLSMGWLKGKSAGNHRFSHEIWDFPANFPLNQSIESGSSPMLLCNSTCKRLHVHQCSSSLSRSQGDLEWLGSGHPSCCDLPSCWELFGNAQVSSCPRCP